LTAVAGRSTSEVVAWTRELVVPALRELAAELPEKMRLVVEYHLGWRDARGVAVGADGGKLLRPTMTLLTALAVGGDASDAVPSAAAVELVHNFSLLHDDVMDRDATRRHRATAWAVFGVPAAVLAGDLLLGLAFETVADSRPAAGVISDAVLQLLSGQSADMSFESRMDVTPQECELMAMGKTGALLGGAAALGALAGGGTAGQVEHLRSFGCKVGLAFQHVDDLLGIWGDPAVTGKPVHSDLSNRKKSLPVVAALTSGTTEGRELAALYGREGELAGTAAARAAALVEAAGGRKWSQSQADRLMEEALEHLRAAGAAPGPAAELTTFAGLAVHRSF
jgi:geranylgeranyl diphosphate synthase type I